MPPVESEEIVQVVLIRKKQGLSREAFSKYYSQVHGPLVTSLKSTMGFDYYEQWHTVGEEGSSTDIAAGMRAPRGIPHTNDYDAMAILWWRDQKQFDKAAEKSDEKKAANDRIIRDELNFLDASKSTAFICKARYEAGPFSDLHPRDLPQAMRKNVVLFPLVRPQGVTREAFQKRWRDEHGPIVEAAIPEFGGAKYMQMHATSPSVGSRFDKSLEFEGFALMWLDPWARGKVEKEKSRAAAQRMLEDEKLFIDLPRSYFMYTEPRWRMTDFSGWGAALTEEQYDKLKQGVPEVQDMSKASKL